MQPSRVINVKDKLMEIGVSVNDLNLGHYDYIGEITAKKTRDPNSEMFKTVGCFFKPNLERSILIDSLIKRYRLESLLEVGFGRGYTSICAAKTFSELGGNGQVFTVESNVDDNHMQALSQIFPQEWLGRIQVARGTSQEILPNLRDPYDIAMIDGDHTKEAVLCDWDNVKDRWTCFCLFDDWLMDVGTDPAIQVHEALADVVLPSDVTCELIVTDRRIFLDDRQWPDERVRYGMLLLTKREALESRDKVVSFKETWDW